MKERPIVRVSLVALLVALAYFPGSTAEAREVRTRTGLSEQFQFEMHDLKVAHQGGNTLALKVSYDYRRGIKPSEYPDFTRLAGACDEFFKSYPNATDFWEILNLKLTALLLREFPALDSVTVEIHVAPTERLPYARASVATRTR